MNGRFSRGVALVETALTVGVALLLVLGAAQMALIGYTQVSADGAAFIAAHTQAANPGANGASTASGVFSQFSTTNFSSPSPSPVLDPSVVSATVGGFSLVPGVASTYSVRGKDVEYAPANVSSTPAPFQFSITNTTLLNDCPPTGNCALPTATSIYLAQSLGNGSGNGVNGQFAEWRCHQKYFARIAQDFGAYPGTGYNQYIKGTDLDVKSNSSSEGNVYSWDTGNHKCT